MARNEPERPTTQRLERAEFSWSRSSDCRSIQDPEACARVKHPCSGQQKALTAERELATPSAGRGDRVAQRRSDGRHRRLANAARWQFGPIQNANDHLRRLRHGQERKAIEISLYDVTHLEGDLTQRGRRQPKEDPTLHLRLDGRGIHDEATVDDSKDAVNLHTTIASE